MTDKTNSSDLESIGNPENIVKDLLNTEKQIAEEALHLYRLRFERERGKWEKLFSEKEYHINELRQRLENSEEYNKKLQKEIQNEKEYQIEQLRLTSEGMKEWGKTEKKKWDEISDQIKFFREASKTAQNNLLQEQDKVIKLKKQFSDLEADLRNEIYEKEDGLIKQKEEFLKKESSLLEEGRNKEGEITALKDTIAKLEKNRDREKSKFDLIIAEYEKSLDKMQKALHDTIINLNTERDKNNQVNEDLMQTKNALEKKEAELSKINKLNDNEKIKMQDSIDKLSADYQKDKQELFKREETIRKNADQQIHNLLKSLEILQKQLENKKR